MKRLEKYLAAAEMDQWGVCSLAEVPLLPVRSKSRIPAGAANIIVMLFGYYTEEYPERNLSRYAIADDYHMVLLPKLKALAQTLEETFPGERFVPFTDASPILEVRAANLAGLGDVGMNGLLLNQVYGSYCLIGELVTTMKLTQKERAHPAICTHCGACVSACPSGALTASGFQKERCRSEITQKKGALTEWEQRQIAAGGMAWGCDCCVDACPVNRRARKSRVSEFYQNRVAVLTEENAKRLSQTKAYGWRGHEILLRNLSYLKNTKSYSEDI